MSVDARLRLAMFSSMAAALFLMCVKASPGNLFRARAERFYRADRHAAAGSEYQSYGSDVAWLALPILPDLPRPVRGCWYAPCTKECGLFANVFCARL
jgi:hypothetical protein